MNKKLTGAMMAMAVAGLFAGKAIAHDEVTKAAKGAKEAAKVKCLGVNECKGKGACSGKGNTCSGQNACKGKGWISLSAEECKAKGGTAQS